MLNQITETHRVLDLAKMVGDVMGVEIAYLPNPRREAEENELIVRNDQFLALGLQPTTLSEGLLGEGTEIAAALRPPRRPLQDHRPVGLESRHGNRRRPHDRTPRPAVTRHHAFRGTTPTPGCWRRTPPAPAGTGGVFIT